MCCSDAENFSFYFLGILELSAQAKQESLLFSLPLALLKLHRQEHGPPLHKVLQQQLGILNEHVNSSLGLLRLQLGFQPYLSPHLLSHL